MSMRTLRLTFMLLMALLPTANRAWALGEVLGQTKDELKLKYDVAVHDHGDSRLTVEFTLADEGRLKPLDAVELNIPGQEKDKGGGWPTDLAVSLEMARTADGKRVARIELRKEWAERAAIWLTTTTFDGKRLATTRYHHVIPIALYMKNPPAAANPADVQWEKMFQVMHGPQFKKAEQLERLKTLIDQGTDVNMAIGFDRMTRVGETRADLRGTTWPLDIAVQQERLDMVKLLLASGAKVHGKELAQAAFARNQEESTAMIKALLEAGADVNSRHDTFTALFWASARGNTNSVKLLLAQPGIKLDQTNIDGDTALMAAAEHGHTEIVEMLLKAGAKVGIIDKRGENAISLAEKALARQQAIVERQQAIISKLQSPPK